MAVRVVKVATESGAEYVFDGRRVTRLMDDGSLQMVADGKPLTYTFWGVPEVGKSMVLLFDPAEYAGFSDAGYVQPMRRTSPVVSIQYDTE